MSFLQVETQNFASLLFYFALSGIFSLICISGKCIKHLTLLAIVPNFLNKILHTKIKCLKIAPKNTIMKKLLTSIYAGLLTSLAVAQGVFDKGTTTINLGLGIGGRTIYWGGGYKASPVFAIAVDHSIYDFPDVKGLSIGLGGYFNFKSISYSYVTTWKDKNGIWHVNDVIEEKWRYSAFGFRPSIHYAFEGVPAEVYGGLGFGFGFISYTNNNKEYFNNYYYITYRSSYVDYGFFIGGRYYFSKVLGVYLEAGYTMSYINAGISLKFGK